MYAEVNRLFGDIVKVTPSSKVVGDMTLFLMAKEMQPKNVLALDGNHDVPFPNSVVEMFSGALGNPPGGWPRKLQKIILRGREPVKGHIRIMCHHGREEGTPNAECHELPMVHGLRGRRDRGRAAGPSHLRLISRGREDRQAGDADGHRDAKRHHLKHDLAFELRRLA